MSRARVLRRVVAAVAVLMMVAVACGGDETDETPVASPPAASPTGEEPSLEFEGPNGEMPTPADELTLTQEEIDSVKSGSYTAALVWHENSEFIQAVEAGVEQGFSELGIEIVASTSAEFDAARQADNVETVLARNPDIIVTIPVDPVVAAQAFRPAVDQGVKLVILTVPPDGYENGTDFVGIVTGEVTEYGKAAAEMLGEALGGQGQVGWIFHDADFWFTNQRDQAFKDWLAYLHPDMEVVAEEGFSDPARTGDLATAMITQNPDLTGMYVAWATAASGVLEALRAAGRTEVKVVTNDLDPTLVIDMLQEANVAGIVANPAVAVGQKLAVMAAYGVLEKDAPDMAVVPPLAVTADNVTEGWQTEFAEEPPPEVQQVLDQS
jgi:ribose transport system substrate-binding protein